MRLRNVKVTNTQAATLDLPLEDSSGGFEVRSIEGLGPVKATLASSSYGGSDGAKYYGGKREPRNIRMTLGLVPDYAEENVGHLRKLLDTFFTPPQKVTLELEVFDPYDNNILTRVKRLVIDGVVETNEPAIFSKDPQNVISIMCFEQTSFCDVESTVIEGFSTSGLDETPVEYDGSVETGFLFTLKPSDPLRFIDGGFTIYHRTPGNDLRSLVMQPDFNSISTVEINTVRGNLYAKQTSGIGTTSTITYGVTTQSDWLQLEKGTNHIRVYATGDPIEWSMEWVTKYGGI